MSFLRFSTCIVAMCFFAVSQGYSQPEKVISTGKQPVKIIPHNDKVHVFCALTDVNFNGMREESDSPASWYIMDAKNGAILSSKEFEWYGTDYVMSATLDIEKNIMYCNDKSTVRKFNAMNQEDLGIVYPKTSSGLSLNKSGTVLAMALRPNFTDAGKVILYNLENGDTTVQLNAGINVRQTEFYDVDNNNRGIIVLNEGLFGSNSSWLHIWTLTAEKTLVDSVLLGNTGNHVFVDGDYAYATVNGSHNIVIVDLKTKKIFDTISTETAGFNGPREAIKIGNELFVTTFEGDVRRISLESKKIIEKFNSHGKPEGLAKVGDRIWIADAFKQGQFSVDSTISVWNYLEPLASISDMTTKNSFSIAPHPIRNSFTVYLQESQLRNNDIRVKFTSMTGEIINLSSFYYDNSLHTIEIPNLASIAPGVYHLQISDGVNIFNGTVIVVK